MQQSMQQPMQQSMQQPMQQSMQQPMFNHIQGNINSDKNHNKFNINTTNKYERETFERSHNIDTDKSYRPRISSSNLQNIPKSTEMEEQYQNLHTQRFKTNIQNQISVIKNYNIEGDPARAIKDFRKDEELRRKQFEDEEKKRRIEFNNSQKYRRTEFEKEINVFEKSQLDAYKILGIQETNDLNVIRRAYKKMAMKYHPDRGGSNEIFQKITKSYMYLMEKIQSLLNNHQYHEMKNNAQDFFKKQENDNNRNINIDNENFNLKIFNKIYEENRLENPFDRGYGSNMSSGIDTRRSYDPNDVEIPNVFSDKFNINVFNTVFNSMKDNQSVADQNELIEYNNPSAIVNQGDCLELGQGNISDFSSNDLNSDLQFTDYMKAHTQSTLINPNMVNERPNYKNLDDLEKQRENIQYFMSPEEIARKYKQDEIDKKKEIERLERLKEYDMNVQRQYGKINQQLLNNF